MQKRDAGAVPTGARAFLQLGKIDIAWCVGLGILALTIRFASPIFPNFLMHPFAGQPVVAWGIGHPYNFDGCVNTPTGPDSSAGIAIAALQKDAPFGPHVAPRNAATTKQCGFVFDEVYFPVDAAKQAHQPAFDFYDPEPELAKLLMAPPMMLFGFDPVTWRATTVIAGSLLVCLVYLIAMRLRKDRFFAVVAALFVCLDGLAFVESRTGLIDIIAIFFAVLCYYVFLLHWQARTVTQWRCTLYALGCCFGLAFAAKLTALAPFVMAIGLIVTRYCAPAIIRWLPTGARAIGYGSQQSSYLWRRAGGRRAYLHYGAAMLVMVVIFFASFSRYSTIEHKQVYNFTSCAPSAGLQGAAHTQSVPATTIAGHSFIDIPKYISNAIDITMSGIKYHEVECRGHPYASRWYTWPVLFHPVLMYADYSHFKSPAGLAQVGWVTNMGNPALWWLAIPALIFCLWRATAGQPAWQLAITALLLSAIAAAIVLFRAGESANVQNVRVHPSWAFLISEGAVFLACVGLCISAVIARRLASAFIILGFVLAWFMWVQGNEQRVLFFYHMLGALPFVALALAYALTALRHAHMRIGKFTLDFSFVAYAGVVVVIAAFIFFYPTWTGPPLSTADHAARIWFDSWQ